MKPFNLAMKSSALENVCGHHSQNYIPSCSVRSMEHFVASDQSV